MPPVELIDRTKNLETEARPLSIDAEALVRELAPPELPHDPAVDPISPSGPLRVAACPVCAHTKAVARYAVRGTDYRLVVCEECGLGSLHPKPRPQDICKFYPPEYYGTPNAKFRPGIEKLVRMAAAWTAKKLTRDLPPGSRVLDVGCGRGVLLSTLADSGYEAHGFEISAAAAEGADPRAQIAVASSLKGVGYPDNAFDMVVLCHVLEHLPHPRETLGEIRRILKPGGRLVVSVPNFSSWQARWSGPAWFHLDLPRHLFHFPAPALKQLLENTGFVCRTEEHFSLRQNPFGWVQSLLNKWGDYPRNALYSLLKQNDVPAAAANEGKSWRLRAAYWLGMPLGLLASLFCAACRNGATITLIAEARSETTAFHTGCARPIPNDSLAAGR